MSRKALEIKALESIINKGNSALYNSKLAAGKRVNALKDENTKQATMDFIFGKSDENPLASIGEEFDKRTKNLSEKKIAGSITGIHNLEGDLHV